MKIKSSAAINSAALAISSALNFLAVFVWTRLLAPGEFGIYALVSAAALLLNSVVFEWLRITGARTLYDSTHPTSIHPARADALVALYGVITIGFLLVGMALTFAGIGFADVGAAWWPVLIAFALTEMGLAIINTVSRVRMNAWQYFVSMVARSVASLVLGLVLVVGFDMGALGALLGIVCAQAVVALAGLAMDPLWRGMRPWRATGAALKAALALGAPLIVSCGLAYAAGVADRFLIGATLGTHAVGLYAAPVDLLQKTLVFLMMAINLTAYPALVRAYEDKGEEAASTMLDRNLQLQLGLGLPVVVGLAVLAPGIAELLLGAPFRAEGIRLLPLVGAAALLRCLTSFNLMMVFQVTRRMSWMIVPPVVTLAVLIPAVVLGARWNGLPGVAVAALAAQAVSYLVCAVMAKRLLPIRLLSRDALKIAAAAAGMGLLLLPFTRWTDAWMTLALIAAGGAGYAVLLIVLRVQPVLALLRALPLHRLRRA